MVYCVWCIGHGSNVYYTPIVILTVDCFSLAAMRRDDSSIDSLEVSPPPRKDQISLSRDSGLTLSDSQLYTPDEEESGSTSSSGYEPAFDQTLSTKAVVPSPQPPSTTTTVAAVPATMPGDYVRVYPGWEERKNINFQRQAWFRQRSKRLTPAASKEAVRRSASEESVLDGGNVPPPPTPPRRSKPATAVVVQSGGNGNRASLPNQQQDQYRKMTASDYYNVVKSEVVVDSLHPNNYSTELTIKPVAATAYNSKDEPPSPSVASVRRVSEVVDCRRYHQLQQSQPEKEEDSSTLSDEDCTPHVSRSNSRGNEVAADSLKLRQHQAPPSPQQQQQQPPAHVDGTVVRLRGRLKRKEEKSAMAASRSRSLPPPPPYRPPPPANRRAPITSYYLGECSQAQQQRFVVTRTYADEESYV